MRIIGLGLDLVETERIGKVIERQGDSFLRRVFTAAEVAYCQGFAQPAPAFAARFAAKEAVGKALGTGISQGVCWNEIEVCRRANGQPWLQLHGGTAECALQLGVTEWHLTLTHNATQSAASVIALG